MKVLSINSGSTSVKFLVIDTSKNEVIIKGAVKSIGKDNSRVIDETKKTETFNNSIRDYKSAFECILNVLFNEKIGNIDAVGHRVVHGGEKFKRPALINDQVIEELKNCIKFAPYHNPQNILGIEICKKVMPSAKMVAVFDTTFHQTIDSARYRYPIPNELYEQLGIRKYGFHGISHEYIALQLKKITGKDNLKIISCHLGGGGSICAIENGKSVNTSMGFTPASGIVMPSRCGDIDPTIIPFLIKELGVTDDEINDMLNKESGLKGLIGKDYVENVKGLADDGNEDAKLAYNMYVESIVNYIIQYANQMNGVDEIVFTGVMGTKADFLREAVCERIKLLDVRLDKQKNKNVRGQEDYKVSTDDSGVSIRVIGTEEELIIALKTVDAIIEAEEKFEQVNECEFDIDI